MFEFQSTNIAFVGSGASACLGYPSWSNLLPERWIKLPSGTIDLKSRHLEPPRALQMLEELIPPGENKHVTCSRLYDHLRKTFSEAQDRNHPKHNGQPSHWIRPPFRDNPFLSLVKATNSSFHHHEL